MIFDLFKNEEVKIELTSEDDYKILSDSIQNDYDIDKVKEKFHYILKEIERAQLEFDELIPHITSNFEFALPNSKTFHSDPTAVLGTKRITKGEELLEIYYLLKNIYDKHLSSSERYVFVWHYIGKRSKNSIIAQLRCGKSTMQKIDSSLMIKFGICLGWKNIEKEKTD